jgi:hypothetical protein
MMAPVLGGGAPPPCSGLRHRRPQINSDACCNRAHPNRRTGNPVPAAPLVRHDTAGEPSRAPTILQISGLPGPAPDLAEFAEDLEHPE